MTHKEHYFMIGKCECPQCHFKYAKVRLSVENAFKDDIDFDLEGGTLEHQQITALVDCEKCKQRFVYDTCETIILQFVQSFSTEGKEFPK